MNLVLHVVSILLHVRYAIVKLLYSHDVFVQLFTVRSEPLHTVESIIENLARRWLAQRIPLLFLLAHGRLPATKFRIHSSGT